jgi:hypothetical protein
VRVPIVLAAGGAVLAAATVAFLLIPSSSPNRASVAPPTPTPLNAPATPRSAPDSRSTESTAPRPAAPAGNSPSTSPALAPVEAAPAMATLHIESDVPDAKVFIDRVGVGTAPITVPDVTPGSHQVTVAAPGFDSYGETIEIEPGARTISVKFREVRLDAQIDAAHKHAMGSCKGRLSASPQGIRYDAVDGKDSFSVALADVTSFEADYLARNLRLRTRDGRTLNFTDPEGNADRLVRFHAAVDKVLKRLAQ